MEEPKYTVVFSGKIIEGNDVEAVKQRLADRFKLSSERIAKLFEGAECIIKKNAPLVECQKMQAAFKAAGALCEIRDTTTPASSDTAAAADTPSADSAETSPAHMPAVRSKCSECGREFPDDELIEYEGARICAQCKPAFVQKLKEGAPVSAGSGYGQYGSVEKALNGQYNFAIGDILKEAWSLVKGSKLIIVGGIICMYVVSFGVSMVLSAIVAFFTATLGQSGGGLIIGMMFQLLIQLLMTAIMYPFIAGLFMVGIRRSAGMPISFSNIFQYFNRAIGLIILNGIMTTIVMIGFLLLIAPGVYLGLAYILAVPLYIEKDMSIWQALETSRKALTKRWFKIFGFFCVLWIILVVSMVPMGIGLIWTAPMATIATGILYRDIFGVEAAA